MNPYISRKAAGRRRKKNCWPQVKDMIFNSSSDISEKLTHLLSYLLVWPPHSSFSDCLRGYLLFDCHYTSQVCSGSCQLNPVSLFSLPIASSQPCALSPNHAPCNGSWVPPCISFSLIMNIMNTNVMQTPKDCLRLCGFNVTPEQIPSSQWGVN